MTPRQECRREARELAERSGWAYTRAERRRIARAGSGPGRRAARRVSKAHPAHTGFSRAAVETLALLAVPGLRPRDVQVRTPQPGTVRVELSGPMATGRVVEAVHTGLEPHTPLGLALEVVAVGGVSRGDGMEARGARSPRRLGLNAETASVPGACQDNPSRTHGCDDGGPWARGGGT